VIVREHAVFLLRSAGLSRPPAQTPSARSRWSSAARAEFVDEDGLAAPCRGVCAAVEKGLRTQKEDGVLAHYPTVDFRATLIDGSYHDVDSNSLTFEIAAKAAFREGCARRAYPARAGDEGRNGYRVTISVIVSATSIAGVARSRTRWSAAPTSPSWRRALSEMFGYIGQLRSMTSGRASYTMEFSHYEPCRARSRTRS